MNYKILVLILTLGIFVVACEQNQQAMPERADDVHQVVVQEVLQANAYTYLRVEEAGESRWLAITKQDVQESETLYYRGGLEMNDFESKDLNRTFETIYFVDDISREPVQSAGQAHQGRPSVERRDVVLEPAEDGITIAELFSNQESYADNIVKIRGKVTKVNAAIMGVNWVHLQDGTEANGNYDLTVTTNAKVSEGDVVTFEGKISLNRDFGAGYRYDVIMEKAELLNREKIL